MKLPFLIRSDTPQGTVHFPWAFCVVTWALLFPMQHELNMCSLDRSAISQLVDNARTGSLMHQLLTVALGCLGYSLWRKGTRPRRPNTSILIVLMAYLSWASLSLTWTEEPAIALRRLGAFLLIFIFGFGCASAMDERSLGYFIAGIIILNLIPDFFFQARCVISGSPFLRFEGTVDPNVQGCCLSLAAIIVFWAVFEFRKRARAWALGTLFGFLVALLFLTGSRTSLIGLSVALLFSSIAIAVRNGRQRRLIICSAYVIITTSIACVIAADIIGLPHSNVSEYARTDRDFGDVTDLTGRVTLWDTLLPFAVERPIGGFGFGAFWVPQRMASISEDLGWPITHGHSAYLDQVLALGFPGAALFVILLVISVVTALRQFWRGLDTYGLWAAVGVFFIVHSTTESIVLLPTLPNLIFAIAIANLASFSGMKRAPEAMSIAH